MPTLIAFHEVKDVDAWLAAKTREEFFGPHGITARPFTDPGGSNRVGLIIETPDIVTFEEAMLTEGAAESMEQDGVIAETLFVLAEA